MEWWLQALPFLYLEKEPNIWMHTGIYKMKLYPLLPLIFIAAYIFVGASIAIQTPDTALTGVAVLAVFMLLYFATKGVRRKVQNQDQIL